MFSVQPKDKYQVEAGKLSSLTLLSLLHLRTPDGKSLNPKP